MTKRKSLPQLKREAQKIVNKYIRLRDSNGGRFCCISCGDTFPVEQMDAGHYFSTSFDSIRFDHDNIHGQCRFNCNNLKEGNLEAYRENLMAKIGPERFEELCRKAVEYRLNIHQWKPWDLEIVIKEHKQLIKELKEVK